MEYINMDPREIENPIAERDFRIQLQKELQESIDMHKDGKIRIEDVTVGMEFFRFSDMEEIHVRFVIVELLNDNNVKAMNIDGDSSDYQKTFTVTNDELFNTQYCIK